MAFGRVDELAKQAAADPGVLIAMRDNPATIGAPLNLTDAHLRALISAGSFTTMRPAFTTSQAEPSHAADVAALEVGTLFPPEGQGQFPTSGEVPPAGKAPQPRTQPPSGHHSPGGAQSPAATPRSTAPHASSPQPYGMPRGFTPMSRTPQGGPGVAPTVPGTKAGVPGKMNGDPSGAGGGASGTTEGMGGTRQDTSGGQDFGTTASGPAVSADPAGTACGCCGQCEVAITSIVAELAATAQTAMAAITAIAGFE